MAADPNDIGKPTKFIQAFWPIVLAGLIMLTAGVRADARLAETEKRVDYIYEKGPPPIVVQLVRMEERLLVVTQALERIEERMDEEEKGQIKR